MSVFVSGATGFVGARLIHLLTETVGFDHITVLSRNQHPFCHTVVCDLQSGAFPPNAALSAMSLT